MSGDGAAGSSDAALFSFCSKWQLAARRPVVWQALDDFGSWSDWWPGLEEIVETNPGRPDGIGQTASSRWKGPIGYLFRFSIEVVERREPEFLRGRATGDLSGEGSWALSEYAGWTGVQLDWVVHANRLAEHLGVELRDLTTAS